MSTNTTVAHNWIKLLPFAVILLAVALTLSLVFASHQPVIHFGSAASGGESGISRGMEAYAARYTAMSEYFSAKEVTAFQANWIAEIARYHARVEAAGLERGRAADAIRYAAMTEYFAAKEAANLQRGRTADTARYNAMAEAYFAQEEAARRGIESDAARYSAMATFYSAWMNNPAQATGMAEHFQTGK